MNHSKPIITEYMYRMGNMIYDKIGDKVFSIILHYPWVDRKDNYTRPVCGIIDDIMRPLENKCVGFDLIGTPFGELTDKGESYYSIGHDNFKLSDLSDGYIFLRNFSGYELCTVDENYITEDNIEEATRILRPDKRGLKASEYIDLLKEMVNMANFPNLK
jgi:hypothetical protein